MLFRNIVEEKSQELMRALKSGTAEDVRHVVIGTSRDTMLHVIASLGEDAIHSAMQSNENLVHELENAIWNKLAKMRKLSKEVDEKRDDFLVNTGLSAVFTGFAAGAALLSVSVFNGDWQNRVDEWSTNPASYLEARPDLVRIFSQRCNNDHINDQRKELVAALDTFLEGKKGSISESATFPAEFAGQKEADLQDCIYRRGGYEVRDIVGNQYTTAFFSGMCVIIALGFGGVAGSFSRGSKRDLDALEGRASGVKTALISDLSI